MPQDKDFKRLVRHRMALTGESYTAARAALERTDPSPPEDDPLASSDDLIELLGHAERNQAALATLQSRPADDRRRIALDGLGHDNWRVRRRCAQLLDDLALVPETTSALTAATDDPNPRVRQAAYHSLLCTTCKPDGCGVELRTTLERMAKDPSPDVRGGVVGRLVWDPLLVDRWVVDLLNRFTASDPSNKIRRWAHEGLARIERQQRSNEARSQLSDDLRSKVDRHPGKWVAVAEGRVVCAHWSPGQIRKHTRAFPSAQVFWVAPTHAAS